jgi:hypothetical protein
MNYVIFTSFNKLLKLNLRKTYINLCTNAFFHNKDKTIRIENLNYDSMNTKERELVIYNMKRELEELSELAT